MPAQASSSASAALRTIDDTEEEIPPLAFETEDELRAVLERWRADLVHRVDERCGATAGGKGKGKGKAAQAGMTAQDKQRVEELVMKVSPSPPPGSMMSALADTASPGGQTCLEALLLGSRVVCARFAPTGRVLVAGTGP